MRGKNYGVCHSCRLEGHFFADCPKKRPCPLCKHAFVKCFEVQKNNDNKGKLFNTCSEKCGFWEWVKDEKPRPESTSVTGTQDLSCIFETKCRLSDEQEMKIDMTVTIRKRMENVTICDKH